MADKWRPLHVREGWTDEAEYGSLHEGVPEWLRASLRTWVEDRLTRPMRRGMAGAREAVEEPLREIERRLRLALRWDNGAWPALHQVLAWANDYPDRFLTALDVLLGRLTGDAGDQAAERLDEILSQGGSAWRVATTEDTWCLERRIDEAVQAVSDKAMEGTSSAARLLSDAWHAAYGRSPNPSEAYRDAVRAAEAAAKPVVTPDDPTATLGKMIVAMRDAPQKWTFTISAEGISGVDVVRELMEVMWKGQHDRHGRHDPEGPIEVSVEEAEAAVHAAATLVHWFRSGAVAAR